jgi:DNA replication protein DnaC
MEHKFYEFVQGLRIDPSLGDELCAIPKQEIRERLRLPKKFELATLHADVARLYNADLYAMAKEYLRNWPNFAATGKGPVFIGPNAAGKGRVAAGLVNEIITRSTGKQDMNAAWLTDWRTLSILDAKDLRSDHYTGLRDVIWKTKLLVVEDLLAFRDNLFAMQFLRIVYSYRYDQNLPTITTVTSGNGAWREIEAVFGITFTDRLRETSSGLVAKAN